MNIDDDRVITGIYALGFFILLSIAAIQPYFEARSFNKLTGGNATYWDAVWTKLRVDGSSQR